MKLYKVNKGSNFFNQWTTEVDYGTHKDVVYAECDLVTLAQTPNCDSFLYLSNTTYNEPGIELLDTVPSGYDFTYCQDWGLTVNQAVVDRVIADLN